MSDGMFDLICYLMFIVGWFGFHHACVKLWGKDAGWAASGLATALFAALALFGVTP